MTEPLCRLDAWLEGDTPVVSLRGEIDLSNVAAVEGELEDAIAGHRRAVVVLDHLVYLDSAAIAALERISRLGAAVQIVLDKRAPIHRALTIAGLDRIIPFHASLPEALA